jgi:hypothetical protein
MCESSCVYKLIAFWKTMIKGDLVEVQKFECINCGHVYIDPSN